MIGRWLPRLRRTTRTELFWRVRVAARTHAQRLSARVRPPQWDRRHLQRVLAPDVIDDALLNAMANDDWAQVSHVLLERLRSRPARFVLDPSRADALRRDICSRWPDAAEHATSRAESLHRGQFDLLGYRALSFRGRSGAIDWHLDPVHQRRSPARFSADIPYLDPSIGDHKIIWELNRHQHWLQFGRALWLAGDARCARGLVNQLTHWMEANPPLIGINWASMLEIGFRSMSWVWALHFLLGHKEHEDFDHKGHKASGSSSHWLVDMFVGLDRQLTHLEHNLSSYFSPNTHLTGEALALYVVGTALPELAGSARWVATGRRILLREIERQVLADGGHAERSTHYQRYTLDFYLLALLTATRAGDAAAVAVLTEAVTRLAEFTRTIADDTGRLPLIGDDDGGMLWPLTGRACDDVRDSLALAAVLLHRADLAPWGVPEEVFWLAGVEASERGSSAIARTGVTLPQPSRTLADTGYVVLRDATGGHLVFDVGDHGYMNGGHAHADALAITLTAGHRPFLADPGTSTYTMDAELRDRMRSSVSHNTVTVDSRSPSIANGPFHWHTRANARLLASRHNPAFDWAEASHDGYAALRHRRSVVRTSGAGAFVADEMLGRGHHAACAHWHFDPRWMVVEDAPGRLRATHAEGDSVWLLHDGGPVSLTRGDRASGRGWHAPVYGTLVPTWNADVAVERTAPFSMLTWIEAADGRQAPSLKRVAVESDQRGTAIAVRMTHGDCASTVMLRPGEEPSREARGCRVLDYQTDGRLFHYLTRGDRLAALDIIDAHHALSLRDGWFSVAAEDLIADLHISIDQGVLDLRASQTPARFSLQGSAVTDIRLVRLNGRDLTPHTADRPDTLTIRSDQWAASNPNLNTNHEPRTVNREPLWHA